VRRRREFEIFSMSFLDAICCGFGAMILLFIVTRVSEPAKLEASQRDLHGVIAQYEEELNDILGETDKVRRNVATTASDYKTDEKSVETLRTELERIRQEVLATAQNSRVTNDIEGKLAMAKQSLTDEMKRLLADYKPPIGEYKIGGIPVDSEYIIFIIDTSGSMKQYAWDRAIEQLRQTLEVYPTVKGIQVMDDEGVVMFKSYRNEWIPDTPARRKAILDGMRNWDAFSNSSPREGILAALDNFYDPNKKISLYVYSDDFAVGTVNAVVREVDRRNMADASGKRRVRIHAVAFPTIYQATGGQLYSAADFATLMRVICQRNGGTFVALPLLRDERRARGE
jgi:hypothetical protein